MASAVVNHSKLGRIRCIREPNVSLISILGMPYGSIHQRFARAKLAKSLPSHSSRFRDGIFDATKPGPVSIQPLGSIKADVSGIPLPTDNLPDNEEQAEDCLNLNVTLPSSCVDENQNFDCGARLPVLVFLHGGAFFLGSANHPYYSPIHLMRHALSRTTPFIFVGINYRLGALGFFHCPAASDLVPANNGLHDQSLALEWVRQNIEGFGGDVNNVSIIGQSAGGESISLHAASGMSRPLYRRAIMFSGSPVTMPAKTPQEHGQNFLQQAETLGIRIEDEQGSRRNAADIARDMIEVDVAKIRELGFVGAPCTRSELMPYDRPSMQMMKQGGHVKSDWVEAQIIGATTYDGGISYNLIARDENRKQHAQGFTRIAKEVLGAERGQQLCDIYAIKPDMADGEGLRQICLFESDIGFFAGALSMAMGVCNKTSTYLHVFDLPNPFQGPIRDQGEFATHTFDITTFLGGVHEERLPSSYKPVIAEWRNRIIDFVVTGRPPCIAYDLEKQCALVVERQGVREVEGKELLEWDDHRRSRLFKLADTVDGSAGLDKLWVDVCRRWLMRGE